MLKKILSIKNGLIFLAVFLSFMVGALASTGNILLALMMIVAVAGVLLLNFPNLSFYIAAGISFLISGLMETFLNFSQANWLSSLSALLLFWFVFFNKSNVPLRNKSIYLKLIDISLFVYIAIFFISSVFNLIPLAQFIVGVRNYLPFLAVFFFVSRGLLTTENLMKVFYFLIFVAALQGLFCILEYFVIAPKRDASLAAVGNSVEVIVGSFGGNPMFGGYTGEMAMFVTMMLFASFILFQQKLLKPIFLILVFISWCIVAGLGETKIVIVMLPLMLFTLMIKYPGGISSRLLMSVSVISVCLVIIVTIYATKYWTDSAEALHAFTYSFDPDFMVDAEHRGRIASIIYWFDQMAADISILNILMGYGPASSIENSSIAGIGNAVEIFGLGLDSNAISNLLWSFGLLGAVSFILIITGSFFESIRISKITTISNKVKTIALILKCFFVCYLMMLPYQDAMLACPALQFMFWFSVAFNYHISNSSSLMES